MRKYLPLLFVLSSLAMASAQTPADAERPDGLIQSAMREFNMSSLGGDSLAARKQAAEQAEIEYQRRIFYGKAQHFVDLWSKMTKQMGQKNTVDVKLVRKVSQAFHDLEKSDGWPVRDSK